MTHCPSILLSLTPVTPPKASDVWSFGILIFEIVNVGQTPWGLRSDRAVIKAVRRGALEPVLVPESRM